MLGMMFSGTASGYARALSGQLMALAPAPLVEAAAPAEAEAHTVTLSVLEGLVPARADLLWLLIFVPLVAAAYIWAARQRRRAMASLGNPALVGKLIAGVHRGNRLAAAVLTVLASLCVVLGLARLQYGGVARIVPASGLDVVLVVDYSKSMLAQDVYPSRSERVAAELRRFLDRAENQGDRVGLVVFAGAARGLPVTRDARLLKLYLQKADPRFENPGGTAIGKALRLALQYLREARQQEGEDAAALEDASEAAQVIILLTDGEDTTSKPTEAAEEAARLGVRIYTVGIGSVSGEPIQKFDERGEPAGYQTDNDGNYVMTRVDEGLLKQLSSTTGGEYVHVDPQHFGLDKVGEWLSTLSRAQREDTVEIHRDEGFAFVVLPGLLLLSVSLALGERRRRKA
ncbi:MAG: VWA domain-containing protein [Myxococcales bacterium]|nr:VWA domain-containing protein [Myxococcales bacterium]MCB9752088.1 VWA domain-containing protein [Myxococcales bacterium]